MKRIVRTIVLAAVLAAPLALTACNGDVYVGVGVAGPWYGPHYYPPVGGWGRPY
jgi:predicted small secreted protein